MIEFVPVMKFPTTLIIVDDNQKFLDNFKLVLGGEYKYQVFASAKEAIRFIEKQDQALKNLAKKYLVSVDDLDSMEPKLNLNISTLHQAVYDPHRFSLSTVIVTDYAMPDMNGLELCEQLKNRMIKIIMLTGEAGYDLAVAGFNERVIDQFVLKSESNFYEKVKEYYLQLEEKLFEQMSKSIIQTLSSESDVPFNNSEFIKFFKKLIDKHNIIEYYLLDASGSYLFVDAKGKIYWLIVKNEEDMRMQYELAAEEKDLSPSILKALKNKQKLAFLPTQSEKNKPVEDWRFEDADCLETQSGNYYYSLVKGTNKHYALDNQKIVSYSDYLMK